VTSPNLTENFELPYADVIAGFIIGYALMLLIFQLWNLYTEWALEFERAKARIYFEEKERASASDGKRRANILTLEGSPG
jgi:hypothetical protein